jgi:uncharacterized protein
MRFLLQDLQQEPIEFSETFAPDAIAFGEEARSIAPLIATGRADLVEEHHSAHESISDIRVRAKYAGKFELPCARCLEPVQEQLQGEFDLLYRPTGLPFDSAEHSISTSETEIGYYQGDGLDLEDVLREQVLLTLPARALCSAECKGLCPHCGQNLNYTSCTCDASLPDTRWNALADLRNRVKP